MSHELSVSEAEERGLMQLYLWSQNNEMIMSQYGKVMCREWIEREYQRISADPKREAAIVTKGIMVTLFVNPVAHPY